MKIILPKKGIIRAQEIDISRDVTIIYGLNNCGKTSALKLMNDFWDRQLIEKFVSKVPDEISNKLSLYIPTNRVVVSIRLTEQEAFGDIEDIINHKRGIYTEYDLHLKRIRDYLLEFEFVKKFIEYAVDKIFHTGLSGFDVRHSDGIENIINIYVNIIWILTWNIDLRAIGEKEFHELIQNTSAYILIDEIEMFLHVSVQSNLIESLTQDFPSCSFVLSTHSPLLLTRYRNSSVFHLENGVLNLICDDLYFKDLDNIYESYFHVKELPEQVGKDIRYLGDVLLCEEEPDKTKIEAIVSDIQKKYPNLYRKYNTLIIKAKDRADL